MIYSIIEACEYVLEEYGGAMSPDEIASQIMEMRFCGATVIGVRNALNRDIKKWGEKSQFVKVGDDEFALGKWPEKQRQATPCDSPTIDAVEVNLFGVLLDLHTKIVELLRSPSLNDQARTVAGERINLLLTAVIAEVSQSMPANLRERLDTVFAESKRIVEELVSEDSAILGSSHSSKDLRIPKQNRVTPFGEIIAVPERGTLMGNRGILHDEDSRVKRSWQGKRWITCTLSFRGRKRTVMSPGKYTELFFLDEATALAAGHRPCAECRHARFVEFCKAWRSRVGESSTANEIDTTLHRERIAEDRSKRRFRAKLGDLPDGVFVVTENSPVDAFLVWGDKLLLWSPGGYSQERPRSLNQQIWVLTPKSAVEVIRAGFIPAVHESTGSA